jgi:predicted RNA-binding Zn ribbon-like protein
MSAAFRYAIRKVDAGARGIFRRTQTDRLAQCNGDTCGWLFLDLTKNLSRRWCDMKGCGNRAKVRRYRGKA